MTAAEKITWLTKVIALVKWSLTTVVYEKIDYYNFGHKIKIKGCSKLTIGKSNKFYGCELDASDVRTEYIKLGNSNIMNVNTIIAGNGGNIQIGDNNIISSNVLLNGHQGSLTLHNKIFIGQNTIIQGRGGIDIHDGTIIAANCFLSSSDHDYSNPLAHDYLMNEIGAKVVIGKKVWIGAGVVVTAGVQIGDFSVIGAGSVVTHSISPYSIAVGSPAKVVRVFNHDTLQWDAVKS
jgi:acetyltransferase-like isoleucine patch superfamily enzyme